MKKRNQMKAVRMNGKVMGYVGKNAYGFWVATDPKRKVLGTLHARDNAVYTVLYNAYDVRNKLLSLTREATARMDKKKLRV